MEERLLMSHFSFVLFVLIRGKPWLHALPRASLSVLPEAVILRCISLDLSTTWSISLKEDRISPRFRRIEKFLTKRWGCKKREKLVL
jgi:hypothetical protein